MRRLPYDDKSYGATTRSKDFCRSAGKIQPASAAGATKIFQEKRSGVDREREELQKCLDYVRQGDTLLVTKLDRLARSAVDLLNIVQEMQGKHVAVKALDQSLDMTTPAGNFSSKCLRPSPSSKRPSGGKGKWRVLRGRKRRGAQAADRDQHGKRKVSVLNAAVPCDAIAPTVTPEIRPVVVSELPRPAKQQIGVQRRYDGIEPMIGGTPTIPA